MKYPYLMTFSSTNWSDYALYGGVPLAVLGGIGAGYYLHNRRKK